MQQDPNQFSECNIVQAWLRENVVMCLFQELTLVVLTQDIDLNVMFPLKHNIIDLQVNIYLSHIYYLM